ncbi:hypothetical protein [Nitrosomonas sp. Nm132]|uniref:hypothetical protein n=1 Tax=Nitrosomonas sp. Nm132 TaxID=1881053 RepID=UPI0015A49D30|nr:hypothetical protein [Nitrosomonas sp. Nm132]
MKFYSFFKGVLTPYAALDCSPSGGLIHENFIGSFFQIHADTFQHDSGIDFYRAEVAGARHSKEICCLLITNKQGG